MAEKTGKDSKQKFGGNQKMQKCPTSGIMGGNQPVL